MKHDKRATDQADRGVENLVEVTPEDGTQAHVVIAVVKGFAQKRVTQNGKPTAGHHYGKMGI